MPLTRQLSAIMFIDVVGYTAVMEDDERKALQYREKFLQHLQSETSRHTGHIYDLRGDGAFCRFASAYEAVHAAIAMQQQLQSEPVVPVRIGIHQGEAMVDEHEVAGKVVNIASRIESLAMPGSILISGKVHDDIKNHKDIDTVLLGRFSLKNVQEPINLYAVNHPAIVVPKKGDIEGKGKLITRPWYQNSTVFGINLLLLIAAISWWWFFKNETSLNTDQQTVSLAVQYFDNMSGDPEAEYFSDGITEEITSTVAQIEGLRVISRSSMAQYKGKPVDLQKIAKELDVQSVLEGSVRLEGTLFKIVASLIDLQSGEYLWNQTFDGHLENIFDVQQSIAKQIAGALQVGLTARSREKIDFIPTSDPIAYDAFQKGKYILYKKYIRTHEEADFLNARHHFEKAIDLDSNFAEPYAGLAELYDELQNHLGNLTLQGTPDHPQFPDSLKVLKLELARKAIRLNPQSHFALNAMAWMLDDQAITGWVDSSLYYLERAYQQNPDEALYSSNIGFILYFYLGLHQQAIPFIKQALATDPLDPGLYVSLGECYINLGRDKEALEAFRSAMRLSDIPFNSEYWMLLSLSYLGEHEIVKNRIDSNPDEFLFPLAYDYATRGEADSIPEKWKNNAAILLALHHKEVRKEVLDFIENKIKDDALAGLSHYNYMMHSKYFDAYRHYPRFQQLLKQVKAIHEKRLEKYRDYKVVKL